MKTVRNVSLIALLLLSAFTAQTLYSAPSPDRKKNDQQALLTFKGKVVDAETGEPLVFASVAVKETNVATVTNIDGEFLIKIGETQTSKNLEVTFLGYKNKVVPLIELRDDGYKNVISMTQAPIPIKEIIVKPLDPDGIVRNANKPDR